MECNRMFMFRSLFRLKQVFNAKYKVSSVQVTLYPSYSAMNQSMLFGILELFLYLVESGYLQYVDLT